MQSRKDWYTGEKGDDRNEWVGNGMRRWWTSAGAVCTHQLESWSCEQGKALERGRIGEKTTLLFRAWKGIQDSQISSTVNNMFMSTWQNICLFSFWN